MNDQTPSPQSVVTLERAEYERLIGVAEDLISNTQDPGTEALAAVYCARRILDAPAPSSLAGGEVEKALDEALIYIEQLGENIERNDLDMHLDVVERPFSFAQTLRGRFQSLCAALSPEAPAREWSTDDMRELVTDEQVRWLVSATDVAHGRARLKDILNALTPRHEAPAEGAGEDVARDISGETVCGFKVAAWRYLGPQDQSDARYGYRYCEHWSTPGNHPKAVERLFTEAQLRDAIRARSSAPEAREGEAVGVVYSLKADLNTAELPDGTLLYTHPAHQSADHAELTRLAEAAGGEALGNLLAVIHGDGGHRALEVGTKQAALEAEKIVAGLFAAPRADKLRIAVEALSWSEKALERYVDALGLDQTDDAALHALYLCGDALTALSTPDALKGDAK